MTRLVTKSSGPKPVMSTEISNGSIIFVPHGGGPLPLMDDAEHRPLTAFLRQVAGQLKRPSAIILVTAHWEANPIRVSSAAQPGMLFDYAGFPAHTYQYRYPAVGAPKLAQAIVAALQADAISAVEDAERGFDHGTFVPLMLMYPDADIPVIQMSLHPSLDPAVHIRIGQALAPFVDQGALLVGSGLSFHNMRAFGGGDTQATAKSKVFDDWLNQTLASNPDAAEYGLHHWLEAPEARFCHPREEHLLPLMVCYGAASARQQQLRPLFRGQLFKTHISGFGV